MSTEQAERTDAASKSWPSGGLEAVRACPVCGLTERALSHKGLTDRVFRCAPGQWDLYRCTGCGTGYLDPRPDAATIGLAYASYFTHSSAASVEQAPRSAWRRHRVAQRNGYLNEQYGYQLEPATIGAPAGLSLERRQRFDKYVAFLKCPGKGGRLLDVGCGNGRFLMQMRTAGWEVCGVEPDPKSAEQARSSGLDVRVGLVTGAAFPESHFDAVSMNHVIEHLHDPVATLKECRRIMKSGGTISIATPNLASAGHKLFGPDWFALDPPRHLVLFTPDSLRRALRTAGFEPEPVLRSKGSAKAIIRRSVHIQEGNDPMQEKPGLSLMARLKARRLARQADQQSRSQPEVEEEIVLLARKP